MSRRPDGQYLTGHVNRHPNRDANVELIGVAQIGCKLGLGRVFVGRGGDHREWKFEGDGAAGIHRHFRNVCDLDYDARMGRQVADRDGEPENI